MSDDGSSLTLEKHSHAEPNLGDLVVIAAEFCEAPISMIALLEPNRQWFRMSRGLDQTETTLQDSFCVHSIEQDEAYQIPDTLLDERFRDNPLVTGEPNIRFYAGVPLITQRGRRLGTLCVADSTPRVLSELQLSILRKVAKQILIHFENHLHRVKSKDVIALLQEANEKNAKLAAIGATLAEVSHELMNPLSIIHGSAGLVKSMLKDENLNPEKIAASMDRIMAMTDRSVKIFDGVRRLAQGEAPEPKSRQSLGTIFDECVQLCRPRFRKNGVRLVVVKTALEITCRPVQLSQVILNLLNNAHDAVQDLPFIEHEKWVELCAFETETEIHVMVADSGPGIPDQLRDKVFDPFFTTKSREHGSGIGLSLSKKIIEAQGGRIFIDHTSPHMMVVIVIPK